MPAIPARAVRLLASTALAASVALTAAGCNRTSDDITGALSARAEAAAPAAPVSDADWRQSVTVWGERYRKDPNDIQAAIAYARALRATDQRTQAVAVLEQASLRHPNSQVVLGAYGRALADNGNSQAAFDVLSRAHTPANPDWRILSVQGTTLDKMGKHEEARGYYASALKIVPEEPSVLSNLGLSYMLTRELPQAEETLRRAHSNPRADARVRQNLALVVGLQGRFAEAETIAKGDLPADEATANVAYLREMLSRKDKDNSRPPGGRATVPVAALNRPD